MAGVYDDDEKMQYDKGFATKSCICTLNDRIWWKGHAPYCVRRQPVAPDLRPDWLVDEEDT